MTSNSIMDFLEEMRILQRRIDSIVDEIYNSEQLQYGADDCIELAGVSTIMERKIEGYFEMLKEQKKQSKANVIDRE